MDASYIIYTGVATEYIPIAPGQDLETILQNIDAAINDHNTAPDYSGYSLGCFRDDYTIETTQEFAEATAAIVCDFLDTYNTFVGTTYVADKLVFTNAIAALQDPELIYAPFSIVDTDSIQQVWAKVFDGLTDISDSIDPSSSSWATISVSPSPDNIPDAFNEIITYISNLNDLLADKEDAVGTFDNSANCLSGAADDDVRTTIELITTYVCDLPSFDPSGYTWGCVTSSSTLDGVLQNIITKVTSTNSDFISTAGTGLETTAGACGGTTVSIDATWEGLYKVAVDSGDAPAASYLEDKIESSDSSITITNTGSTLDLSIATPVDGKVKVESGGTADYLDNKIVPTTGNWGLAINTSIVSDALNIAPTLSDPRLFIQNFIAYISAEPDLLTQFCALVAQCAGCQCAAPTGLTVEITTV